MDLSKRELYIDHPSEEADDYTPPVSVDLDKVQSDADACPCNKCPPEIQRLCWNDLMVECWKFKKWKLTIQSKGERTR